MAAQTVDKEIKAIVRKLCGVALSNGRAPPAMNTACIAIAMCKQTGGLGWIFLADDWVGGDRFADRSEQEALMEILVETDSKHAWPTSEVQLHLKQA